jgi:hypothetical protein
MTCSARMLKEVKSDIIREVAQFPGPKASVMVDDYFLRPPPTYGESQSRSNSSSFTRFGTPVSGSQPIIS